MQRESIARFYNMAHAHVTEKITNLVMLRHFAHISDIKIRKIYDAYIILM